MPKLSFNPDKEENIIKCTNCIYSHKIINGDKIYYECFPVKEDSKTVKSQINCERFFNTKQIKRDVYISILVYILYPKFEYKITPIGCIFRNFDKTYDELWKELKDSDFYDRVKQGLSNVGFVNETLFEPIFFAEKNFNESKWRCISAVLTEKETDDILEDLNNNDNKEE